MNNVQYFDEEQVDAAVVDGAVQAMARRQLGVSLVVAFALLAAAGLIAARAPRVDASATVSIHRIAGVQAPEAIVTPPMAMNKE